MRTKTWIAATVLSIALVCQAGLAHALDKGKVYKFGVDINYPPFSSMDQRQGQLVGFDVDVSKAVCRTIGIQCEILGVTFDEIIPMVERGDLDVGCAGFTLTPERAKNLLFSDEYFRTNSIFVQKNMDLIKITPEIIKGMSVAVQKGTVQEDYLRETYKGGITIIPCNTFADVMEAVGTKQADLGLADSLTTYKFLRTDNKRKLDIAGDPIPLEANEGYMILNLEAGELRDAINTALQSLRDSGEYDGLSLKYFDYVVY
jgi:ABC-type amino acid transport substrate-binding protein